jgi:perosamine synthetase
MIPLFRPALDQREVKAVTAVLRSGWIGAGPKVDQFETKFARYAGAKYAVAVSSASSALQLALQGLVLKAGSEIISPSLTFIATNHAILLNNLSPVFCDIDPDTLCADPADIAHRITPKTRAVVVMHYGGHPVDLDPLVKLCRQKKLYLIEDCAHATGSYYRGKHVGTFGTMGCFSFAAIKNLTTGDGGMIVTNSKPLADHLKVLRWSGISKDTWHRSGSKKYSWEYDVVAISGKHQMNDIAAAIGLVQLTKLRHTNSRRLALTRRYNLKLKDIPWLTLPRVKPWAVSSHHNYVIKIDPKIRNKLIDYLNDHGITSSVHYLPTHHYRLYRRFAATLPVTDKVWRQILLLPLYPTMTLTEQDKIIAALHQFKP